MAALFVSSILPYLCGLIQITPFTSEYLVKLNPDESIKHIQDSNYWVGNIEFEPVTIIVEYLSMVENMSSGIIFDTGI